MTLTISGSESARAGTSSQWASRPNDQRFTSLQALLDDVRSRDAISYERSVANIGALRVVPIGDGDLGLRAENATAPAARLTNWSMGQLAARAQIPASFVTKLGSDGEQGRELAIKVLNYGLDKIDRDQRSIKAWLKKPTEEGGNSEIRSVTSEDYGRIADMQVVQSVVEMNERQGGIWKVPGVIEYREGGLRHNPEVEPTRDNTTLYASDRDVYIFLVDDRNPIEIAPGDFVFRGFVVKNSAVGSTSLVLYTFYLRGVCCNRLLWGVEEFKEYRMPHRKGALAKFQSDVVPSLSQFSEGRASTVVQQVNRAKVESFANDEACLEFMTGRKVGLPMNVSKKALEQCRLEEERDPRSLWDIAMGVSALARSVPHQDRREELELSAKKVLDLVV